MGTRRRHVPAYVLSERVSDATLLAQGDAVLSAAPPPRRFSVGRVHHPSQCGDDRRGAYVVVTKQGRQAIAAGAPRHLETVRQLFIDRLTPSQLETIGTAAEVVLAGLGEEEDG